MRHRVTIATVLWVLVSAGLLRGQAPQEQAPKVVTISFNAAVLQTAEARRELAALQTKFAPRETQLKTLSTQIEELRKNLEATSDKLADTERASREEDLSNKQKQLQRGEEDFRADSQSESQQIFQNVAQKVYAFLQTYSQQHGYSMVVERGSDAAPVVWYANGNLDITGDVVKAYDAQAPSALPAAPAPHSLGTQKPQQPASPPR